MSDYREMCEKCRAVAGWGSSPEEARRALSMHRCLHRTQHSHYSTVSEVEWSGKNIAECSDPACWALSVPPGASTVVMADRSLRRREKFIVYRRDQGLSILWDVWLEQP